ncbi:Probable bifunctional chitinase/lysozyme precursor [Cedecea neteri]|uniref:Probable bifunctional chitinase/lysozyme n=1 Tax=Cedecea neteri TaxID=158822 RepID=A0A291E617_9ENTR|nr:carbohydrate-binding protein [Cedecea neteri]ATF95349.1 hypothetical protein CO704_24930 [Cedecea neteri]SQC92003.1 Probable bifunctional chitinase/lysozyme precursor [Cedecea neteri]
MTTKLTPFIDVTVNATWSDWQNFPAGRPNALYSQQAVQWDVDGLVLGFLTLSPGNKACWAAQDSMPLGWAVPLAEELKTANRKVIVAFGGAANPDISTSFSVPELQDTYQSVIDLYHADGLDFDLENGLYDATKICQAIAGIQTRYPQLQISFTLPVMPDGLTATGIDILRQAQAAGLDFVVNGMAMDYYNDTDDADMAASAIKAATSISDQLKTLYPSENNLMSRVAVTPMIGMNDDPNEMFTLENADRVGQFANRAGLCFVAMWSFNRDNPSSLGHADAVSSSNPEQKVSGEYTQRFRAALTDEPVIPDDAPAAPEGLIASDLSSTSVTLTWSSSATDVSSYAIFRDGEQIARTESMRWADTSLTPATKYVYFLTAIDSKGNQSKPGEPLAVTTAQSSPDVYPEWESGIFYSRGNGVSYKGKHYLCLQQHLSILTWTPDETYSLWECIN